MFYFLWGVLVSRHTSRFNCTHHTGPPSHIQYTHTKNATRRHSPQENNGRWADCSDAVFYYFSREDRHAFMQPIYNYLLCVRARVFACLPVCVDRLLRAPRPRACVRVYSRRPSHPDAHTNSTTHKNREDKKELGLQVMVFSGDDDSVCATQGTGLWIAHMPWAVAKGQEWMAWYVCALGCKRLLKGPRNYPGARPAVLPRVVTTNNLTNLHHHHQQQYHK